MLAVPSLRGSVCPPLVPRACGTWLAWLLAARSILNGGPTRTRSSPVLSTFPALGHGPRRTSRCGPCAGPTPFQQATWDCSKRRDRSLPSHSKKWPSGGALGGPTRPCTCGRVSKRGSANHHTRFGAVTDDDDLLQLSRNTAGPHVRLG